jgi:predicted Fe-Mo cluster-binding NifX family protein
MYSVISKKVALPTRDGRIDDHFGHCEMYTVFSIGADQTIVGEELIPSPEGCGCKSDIAAILQGFGVSLMLAGNMGEGALNVLKRHGIDVVRGCHGEVRDVAEAWLRGELTDSGLGCEEHAGGHSCGNH